MLVAGGVGWVWDCDWAPAWRATVPLTASSRITFISSQVDTETQTVLAKATVENASGNLRIAQQVRAQVVWGSHEGTVIPILSVTRINGEFFAFLAIKDGQGLVARQKLLKIGETVGNDYAVLDGIQPGDHIIVSGLQFLRDGAPVMEQSHTEIARCFSGLAQELTRNEIDVKRAAWSLFKSV